MRLSEKAKAVKPSATLGVAAKAKRMKAEGVEVFNFSTGEPDFPTPKSVCKAAHEAIDAGHTKYTLTPGILELRQAVCRKFERDYGFAVTPEQVVVSGGAKHSLYLVLMALIDPGEEVIIPAPYWVSYPSMVELCGAVPVIAETRIEEQFKLRPEALRRLVTPKTRALILNSPSNPTGQVYTRAELEALAEVVAEKDLIVICDDIYEKLVYRGASFTSMSQISPAIRERCVVVNGVSKCASMTGWRIGYLVAEKAVAGAVSRLQEQMTSHASSIAQYAAVEALDGCAAELSSWVREFEARRDLVVGLLNDIQGIRCPLPDGAFYAFADWRGLLGRKAGSVTLNDDLAWADYLLDEAHVACVPGSGFGASGILRFSFATSREVIERGMKALREAVDKTQQG